MIRADRMAIAKTSEWDVLPLTAGKNWPFLEIFLRSRNVTGSAFVRLQM